MKYRLGRKQNRVILSEDGTQEIAFVKGYEGLAQKVVDLLNDEATALRPMLCYKCGCTISWMSDVAPELYCELCDKFYNYDYEKRIQSQG